QQRNVLITQGRIDLLHIVEHVALRHKQVLPAVVVEVLKAHAPSGTERSQRSQATFQALVGKKPPAVVVIQGVDLPRQHGNENIGAAIVVIVLKDNAHPGKTFAVGSETCSGFESAFLKGAIAGVVKQKLLHAVIRDENVRKSVAVVVGERHS